MNITKDILAFLSYLGAGLKIGPLATALRDLADALECDPDAVPEETIMNAISRLKESAHYRDNKTQQSRQIAVSVRLGSPSLPTDKEDNGPTHQVDHPGRSTFDAAALSQAKLALEGQLQNSESQLAQLREKQALVSAQLEEIRKERDSAVEQVRLQSTKILQHEETVSQSSTLKRDFVLALIELRDQLLRPKLEPDLDKGKLVTYISKLAMTKLGRLGVVEICEADLSIASDLQVVDDYVPTNNPDLHRRIAATIQVGYKTDDEVIRSQKVVVYNLAGPEGA